MENSPTVEVSSSKRQGMEDKNQSFAQVKTMKQFNQAGKRVATLATFLLDNDIVDRSIVVLVGRAGIGEAGLAAACYLLEAGAWVQTVCTNSLVDPLGELATKLSELQAMGAPIAWAEEGWELPPCDLLIDALIGCGLKEDPQGKEREMILLANSSPAPILSVEVPSGVDCEEGHCFSPHITAIATLLSGVPKQALLTEKVRRVCGELYLANIGIPAEMHITHKRFPIPNLDANGLLKL